jgi:hypothetical protein
MPNRWRLAKTGGDEAIIARFQMLLIEPKREALQSCWTAIVSTSHSDPLRPGRAAEQTN